MSEPMIVLEGLTKSYGKHRGIENISFSVNSGEVFGFIGPNGAGKSYLSFLNKSQITIPAL